MKTPTPKTIPHLKRLTLLSAGLTALALALLFVYQAPSPIEEHADADNSIMPTPTTAPARSFSRIDAQAIQELCALSESSLTYSTLFEAAQAFGPENYREPRLGILLDFLHTPLSELSQLPDSHLSNDEWAAVKNTTLNQWFEYGERSELWGAVKDIATNSDLDPLSREYGSQFFYVVGETAYREQPEAAATIAAQTSSFTRELLDNPAPQLRAAALIGANHISQTITPSKDTLQNWITASESALAKPSGAHPSEQLAAIAFLKEWGNADYAPTILSTLAQHKSPSIQLALLSWLDSTHPELSQEIALDPRSPLHPLVSQKLKTMLAAN